MAGLVGKTALVTGASRGYGRAIARRLARDGAFVVVHYSTNAEAADVTVAAIKAEGGEAVPLGGKLDGSPASVDALFASLDDKLAASARSSKVDILVNNAAISPRGNIENTSEELYDEVFAVNAKAPFFILQRVLSRMPDGGRIVNISSQTSLIAFPDVAAYSMAKGAIDLLTKVAAKHLAPRNITVNAVMPGIADTDMNASWLRGKPEAERSAAQFSAFGRIADVTDVADIVGFLASNDARWVTGQWIDGGGGSRL
jgi:NAD(P)-dependent dehydrogenase (short-subunit alcohol dehydrogenase family)